MRELVLDTETTGLDPKDNHRVIELACVELINYIPTGVSWHWYFNPERDVPRAATEIYRLTEAFLADKPLFGSAAADILGVLEGARLIIHNAAFDVGFLNHEFGRPAIRPRSASIASPTPWRSPGGGTPAAPTISTRCAAAMGSIIRHERSTARCWIASFWRTFTCASLAPNKLDLT